MPQADSEASDAAAQLNAKDKELQKFCPTDSQPLDTLKPRDNLGLQQQEDIFG